MRSRNALSTTVSVLAGWRAAEELLKRTRAASLRGRAVLITGGTRGLGLTMARECLGLGAGVAICGRDPASLERALADLRRRGSAVGWPCDLRHADQIDRLVEQVRRELGPPDVLTNNAGIIQVGPVETMTLDDYDQAMAVHYWAPLRLMRAVIPEMRRRGFGRIVNISSIGGKLSVPHLQPYCGSKFALAGLSQGMAAELRRHGVLVTTVYPGLMRTGSPRNAQFKGRHRDEFAWFSISGSLPGLTISAEAAARQIIAACRRGDPELILSWPARIAVRLHGLLPGTVVRALAVVHRLLPEPGGIGTQQAAGRDSASRWSPSALTRLSDQAAGRNNELDEFDRERIPSSTISNKGA